MPAYSFKRNCKVYLVVDNLQRKIEVYPDLAFSQTFEEKAHNVKTLHDQTAMFEEATINKANPASFNFTVLLVKDNDFDVIGDWITGRGAANRNEALFSYDIYVDTGVDIFKIQKSVPERATFQIIRDALVTVSIQGSASRLTRFGPTGTVIPGNPEPRDVTLNPVIPRATLVELDGVALDSVAGITLELSNEVQWLEYDTLHKSLYVTSASETLVPEAFVVSKKVLSGTIQQYLTDTNNARVNSWSTNSTLRIRVGEVGKIGRAHV